MDSDKEQKEKIRDISANDLSNISSTNKGFDPKDKIKSEKTEENDSDSDSSSK
ncbi:hypothetical protein K0M31_007189 [Melipona bicolor]|uniref:Uncharacterized protein n=1 Tax=Melipona bicolor TaxID=60889 RepID=A0AA40KKV1_9HYME|nr:hypothetical protein K0M31_007189 [Melipona bicolor]